MKHIKSTKRIVVCALLTLSLVFVLPFGTAGLFGENGSVDSTKNPVLKTVQDTFDVNAYAAVKKFKVTFKANGGKIGTKSSTVKKVKRNKKVGTLPTVTRNGYTFKGWYVKKSGGKKISNKTKIKSKVTYYAHWTTNKYTITFNGNTGAPSFSSKSVKYKKVIGALPTATKPEYMLAGWYTAAVGGTKFTDTTVYKTAGDITLYAHWIIKDRVNLRAYSQDLLTIWDIWVRPEEKINNIGYKALYYFQTGYLKDNEDKSRFADIGSYYYLYDYWNHDEYNYTVETGSYITYLLDCKFTNLSGTLFLGWESRLSSDDVTLKVYNDNILVYTSPVLTKDVKPISIDIDVRNVERMKIEFVSDNNTRLPEFGFTASFGQL
jgi:uncharacterized repeat protein (TIGR02543 family)